MAYIDEYGVEYTDDKKCVFRAPNNLSGKYQILEGVKEIYSNAFSYCENLKEIYIPNTVMSIGENAFESCSSLTEIQLPRYLETIDNNTFSNCVSLNKIIFGEELKIIGIEAFSNCTALLTVDFPSSLMVILSKAFVNCTSLKEIFIPRNLKDVDSSAFEGCANLDFLDVDNNNPFLCSFSSCIFTKNLNCLLLAPPKLNELTIPAETVKVDPLAFLTTTICPIKVNYLSINCEKIDWAYLRTSVEQVVIGKEVSYLPSLQFAHFENLSQVICESQSLAYVGYNVFHLTPWFEQSGVWENGVLYLGNCILKAQSDFYGKCTLIDGISVVAAEAFANCKNISSVKFNSSLTSVGERAFLNCERLKNVAPLFGIKSIKEHTFKGCKALESIIIPEGIEVIEKEAFCDCSALNNISLPNTLVSIFERAFKNCESLTNISIPNTVKLPPNRNYRDNNLSLFDGCCNLSEASFHYRCIEFFTKVASQLLSITLIGDNEYYDYNEPADSYRTLAYLKGFTSLKNVIIHKNVPIAHYRYSYSRNNEVYLHTPFFYSDKDSNTAKAIESITFIDTSVIPYYFCKGMSNLKWLTIKGSCYAIEKCAFIDCKNLKQIEITDTISVIGKCAFSENVLSVLSLPQSVRIIKSFEPYIHNGDPYIRKNEDYASFFTKEPDPKIFSMIDYKGEENLVIPEGFTSIAPNTFSCLENLKTVTLPSSMLTIGKFAFSNCRNLSKIILNEGLETISSGAFNKCTSLSTITLPKTLKVIGYGAFNDCIDIDSLALPPSLEYCGVNLFGENNNLSSVTFAKIPQGYLSQDGVILNYLEKKFGLYDILFKLTKPSYNSSINTFNRGHLCKLKKVSFLGDVVVPQYFCAGLVTLESVEFNSCNVSIGWHSFSQCSNLKNVVSPAMSINNVSSCAFWGCHMLNCIELSGVEHIGYSAFSGCKMLTKVNLKNCKKVEDKAFEYCSQLIIEDLDTEKYKLPLEKEVIDECNQKDVVTVILGNNLERGQYADSTITEVIFNEVIDELPVELFANCTQLTSITLPFGLKKISRRVFCGCCNLQKIIIPDSVETIDEEAFLSCSKLEEIVLSKNISVINKNCFNGCSSLRSIILPEILISIKDEAFKNCKALTEIKLPNSLTFIGDCAFESCEKLEEVTIPENVVHTGFGAFRDSGLKTLIWLPSNISQENAFLRYHRYWKKGDEEYEEVYCSICSSIEKVVLGEYVARNPFEYYFKNASFICLSDELNDSKLLTWELRNNLDNYENGVLYYDNVVLNVSKNIKGKCVIKEGTIRVAADAFRDAQNITEVILPESVVKVGARAFWGCDNLQKIKLPSGLKQISSNTFNDCSKLETIIGSECVEEINNSAFYGCSSLSYVIPATIKKIGDYAFSNSQLKAVPIFSNLIHLGKGAFANTFITSLMVPDTIVEIPEELCKGCRHLTDVELSSNIQIIGSKAFQGCDNLIAIELPSKIREIKDNAFSFESRSSLFYDDNDNNDKKLTGLKCIKLPKSLESVGEFAFANSKQLYEVVFENEKTLIGKGAFKNCIALRTLMLPENLKIIEEEMLYNCISLEEIIIPETVFKIAKGAFSHCINLKELNLPDTIEIIFEEMCYGCKQLTKVKFPPNLKKIYDSAFSNCDSLCFVNLPATVEYLANSVFSGCNSLYNITIPNSVEYIGSDFISYTNVKQLILPASIKHLRDNAFKKAKKLRYVLLLCTMSENDWGVELFPEGCIVLSGQDDVSSKLKSIDQDKYATWQAEADDFERYCEDSFRAAFEGDPEAMGGIYD